MQDNKKTKAELLSETEKLRKRLSSLENKLSKLKKSEKKAREEFKIIENAVQGWKKTIDSSGSMMILIGKDFRVRRANLAAANFFGMSFKELLGRNCAELFLDKDLSIEDCLIEKVKISKKHEEAEFYLPEKKIWMLANVDPIFNSQGELIEIVQLMHDITEQKRTEEKLSSSEEKYRSLVDHALVGIYTTHLNGNILFVNKALCRIFGYKEPGELIDTNVLSRYKNEHDREIFLKQIRERGAVNNHEVEYIANDGRSLCFLESAVLDGEIITGMLMDITERRLAEERIKKINRALQMISACNHVLVHAKEEKALLNDICKVIIEMGGYRLAWIGFVEHDEMKTVRPVAYAGYEEGYLEKLQITWADTERGRGPTGTSVRTVTPVIAKNIQTDNDFEPWRADALKRGYNSGIALPLLIDNIVIGSINIYSPEPEAFDTEEVKLLDEMTRDLSYGIRSLRIDADRKKAEDNLFAIKQDWEFTFNSITDMVTVHDINYNIILANKAAQKILRLPFMEKLSDKKCFRFYHGTDTPPEGCPSCDCLKTGVPASFEIFEPHLNMFIEIRAIPRFDSNNKLMGLIHIVRDITADKLAEENLKFMASIIQNLPDSVCSIDLEGHLLSWNEGAERMLGYKADEIIGKHINSIIPENLQKSELEHCVNLLMTQGFFTGYESERITKDGRRIPVEITGAVLRDENNRIKRFSAIMKDITERRNAEAEIKKYSDNLEFKIRERTRELEDAMLVAESADRAKSMFLANISHELRTPLNAIIGFSEALSSGVYGDLRGNHREYINDIHRSGVHLLNLINEILDLSKIEAGKMVLEYSECSINDVINSSVYMLKEKARKHNIELKIELEEGIGGFTIDEIKVKQVIINLLSNAFKFSPEGGRISVQARKMYGSRLMDHSKEKVKGELSAMSYGPDNDFIEISVTDTGSGISEEDMEKIFHPFEQVVTTLKAKKEGTGLGLALSRRIVEMHGGRIWVESPPADKIQAEGEPKGSRFIFVLPRKPAGGKI